VILRPIPRLNAMRRFISRGIEIFVRKFLLVPRLIAVPKFIPLT